MAGFSRLPAISASQRLGLLARLLLRSILSFVVGLSLALPFPLGGALFTELVPAQTFPATGAPGNFLLGYGLGYPYRPSEAEHLEQVKAVLCVFVPAPVVFADLLAQAFAPRPPAHVSLVRAFRYVAVSVHSRSVPFLILWKNSDTSLAFFYRVIKFGSPLACQIVKNSNK
jgi:hypothetical protein